MKYGCINLEKGVGRWKSLKCGENEKAVDRQTCIEAPALYIYASKL